MQSMRKPVVVLAALALCAACSSSSLDTPCSSPADLVLTGGQIYTVNDAQPWAEAVAVTDGRFAYVGSTAGVESCVGDQTRRIDLGGRFVMPGMVDSHTHPGLVSLFGQTVDEAVIPTSSQEDILTWFTQFAEENADELLLTAEAWPVGLYNPDGPNKADLDAITTQATLLFDDSGHSVWLNSSMLALLGIDNDTPDPVPGLSFFVRDENGELTGWVKEFGAIPFFLPFEAVLVAPQEEREAAMVEFLNSLATQGVTTLYDAGTTLFQDTTYEIVAKLEREGRLPVRYEGTYHIILPEQTAQAVDEIERFRREYGGELLRFNTVKIHLDGVAEIRTAAFLDPYLDDPENSGGTLLNREELTSFILELEEAKLDLHLHVVGDRATRTALDAYEAAIAQAGGELRLRLTLSHLELINDKDLPRFAELGVLANHTPHWHGNYFQGAEPGLGPERYSNRERAVTLGNAGAILTFSSDVTTYPERVRADPFFGMQIGHNRQDIGEEDGPVRPPEEERLPLETLVRGYTLNGAYQLRMDADIGSIEAGKLADMVVLNNNLLEADRTAIYGTVPAAVLRAGEVVSGAL